MKTILIAALSAGLCAQPVFAKNIVLTNDDGLTSNVKALYEELKAQGHDVIVTVPCTGQSGMGAAVKFMRPLGPLTADCLNGAAKAGDPGAGPMTRAGFGVDWNYVDGTPVMATLYGIDVLAKARWGKAPDLVLSGPNEGQNLGHIVISSGTVSNVQYAAVRGIPAIALSAGMGTVDNATLANPASVKVARLTTTLLAALEKAEKGGRIIPAGITLNVNFPDKLDGAPWLMTQIGSYDAYDAAFVASLGKSGLPGVAIGPAQSAPTPDQKNDESVANRMAITVSAMQIGYEAPATQRKAVGKVLKGLVAK